MPECRHGLDSAWCALCRTEPVTTIRADERAHPSNFPVQIGDALCATFDPEDELVPVTAYTITRILPVYRGFRG